MKNLLICAAFATGLAGFNANAASAIEVENYERAYELGNAAIKNENYDKAYTHLRAASEMGNKVAQFSLALMYMEGKGVKQNYTEAYLWLNVASEADERKWRKVRDQIKDALSEQQKVALQPYVDDYLGKYGAEAQEVSCYKKAPTGSRIKRMTCVKQIDAHERRL
ncbi:sel1 repeat family protein [Aliikangiella marina]|uniref:Sel1 repeat family protein n=1 Tax=Aliikangiella marina TaxID=1712262 RepID=A0A545T4K5_9GAMM|nr:SEL1-like repeat protein [Aliikangiella marina]TQV72154.1 sel1 repeat family protein [Aliikangiella marina]